MRVVKGGVNIHFTTNLQIKLCLRPPSEFKIYYKAVKFDILDLESLCHL